MDTAILDIEEKAEKKGFLKAARVMKKRHIENAEITGELVLAEFKVTAITN